MNSGDGRVSIVNDINDVFVFRSAFVLDEPEHLLVPRSVVHHQGVLETFPDGVRLNEFTDTFDCGGVVEPTRFEDGQPADARHHETAVGNLVPAGKRFHLGPAPLLEPSRGYRGLRLEMNFVLIYGDQFRVFLDLGPFF